MNRFDRITAILIQLQSRRIVKAQDLADRFEVSLRTVYRDIRSLEEAGVPIYGEAGVGYSIMDGYRLPPVMFTKDEATAIVAAEKIMERFEDVVIRKNFQSFAFKVKSVLRNSEKDLVEELEDHIHISTSPKNDSPSNALDNLFRAIADKRSVKMKYFAMGKGELTERIIDPIGVYHEFEHWYTVGYCHLRNDYRSFRLDRIKQIDLTYQPRKNELISLQDYQQRKEKKKLQITLQKVVLRVDSTIVRYLSERKHHFGYLSEEEVITGKTDIMFLTNSDFTGFVRWVIMFADYAEILQPDELKTQLKELIEKIYKKF